MICRLCLIDLLEENGVPLFNHTEPTTETHITKMIAKYLQVEVTLDDAISTYMCGECYRSINDFHQFYQHVEQKQHTLRNEFLEVKCVLETQEEPLIADNEESLLDMKDVLLADGPFLEEFSQASNDLSAFDEDETITNNNGKRVLRNRKIPKETIKKQPKKRKTVKEPRKSTVKKSKTIANSTEHVPLEDATEVEEDNCNIKVELVDNGSNNSEDGTDSNYEPTINKILKLKKTKKPTKDKTEPKKDVDENDKVICENMRLKCEICEMEFEVFHKLQRHFHKEHNCKGFMTCCGKRFEKRLKLADHIRLHLDPNYFTCKLCQKILKTRNCLDTHMESTHPNPDDMKFECPDCKKRFLRERHLRVHSLVHSTVKNFACQQCDKAFVTKSRLDAHSRSIHENVYKHICDFCGRKFKTKPSFDQHVREHNGIQEPTAQCPTCGDWLKNNNCLRKHIRLRHTERKPTERKCKYCDRSFWSQTALQGHVRYNHKMAFNLRCPYCEKIFKMKANLEEHISMHTGEKHNTCSYCPREFRSKANMYAHIKRDHYEKWKIAREKPTSISAPPISLTTESS